MKANHKTCNRSSVRIIIPFALTESFNGIRVCINWSYKSFVGFVRRKHVSWHDSNYTTGGEGYAW